MRQVIEQRNRESRIEQWGVSVTLPGPWAENQLRTVLQHKPYRDPRGEYCVPIAQSLLLTANPDITIGNNSVFRWSLNVGGGGGSQRVLIDALNIQQVSLAAENIDVSLVCEKFVSTQPYLTPAGTGNVKVGVSLADGNVSSSPATYTQGVDAPNGLTLLKVPFMAGSFRLEGPDDASTANPFVANVSVQVGRSLWQTLSLKTNFYSGDFIPLPGNADTLFIQNNTVNTLSMAVQWGLDL